MVRKRLTERWRRLGRTARILLAAGVAAVVIGGGAGAWALTREDTAQPQAMQVQATSGTVKETVSASGTVEAAETADLSFEVSGTVTKIYAAEGDTVKKGDALARVDDTTLVANRTAAESALTAAQEQLDTDESAGASDVQIASDEAAVAAAEADLDSARQAVKDAVLRATIGGTVTAFDIAVGDVVGSSSGSSAGGSDGSGSSGGTSGGSGGDGSSNSTSAGTVSIVSAGSYVVEATVSADDAASLKKGLQATVTVNGVDEQVDGTVATVGKVAETSSSGAAVFPVSITVTGKRDDLYPGTSATAEITVKQREDVLTVASAAITTDGDQAYVQKIVDGKTVRTEVTIGEVYGTTTEITEGLAEGDTVEIEGFTRPSGGGAGSGGRQGGPEGGFEGFGGEGGVGQMPGGVQFPGGGMPDQTGGDR